MFTRFEKFTLTVCIAGAVCLAVGYGKPLGTLVSPPLFWGGMMACVFSMHRRGYQKEVPMRKGQLLNVN
jgi:hypothetical protein